MQRLFLAAALLVALAATALASNGTTSGSTTVVVDPTNMNGWGFYQETAIATGALVAGPAPAPLGTGSAQMVTVNGSGGEILGTFAYAGTQFSNVTNLEYATYQSAAPQAISLQFEVDYNLTDGNLAYQGRLVYEPYFTETVLPGTWQTWDPQAGKWYATSLAAFPSGSGGLCPMATPCTWAQVLTNWPNAGVRSAGVNTGATLLKAGSGWPPGWTGHADKLTIGVGGNDTIFDFEPSPPPCTMICYVRTDGSDSNPGTADTPALAKRTIQAAVNQVSPSGLVSVAAGTYDQNVVLTKTGMRLIGAGQALTILRPGVSDPNCGGAGGGSLCPGASNVLLVQAGLVEISQLAIDGDNTTLTSAYNVGGANIDARNGIIENYSLGVWNATSVHDVTVRNVFLRGIYMSSGGSGFILKNNTLSNVQADPGSIAIFNYGGTGLIQGNNVTDANDGIAANWSRGTVFRSNVVTSSGSGVHTDNNGGSGGGPDLLEDNTVTNCDPGGYGVWTFAPFVPPTVNRNTVTNCEVGLAASGRNGASPITTTFTDNVIDGQGLANSTGAYVTTWRFGFGDTDVHANFTGNIITGNDLGMLVETTAGFTANVTAGRNIIAGNVAGAETTGPGTQNNDLRINWWGSDTGPNHTLNLTGTGNSVTDGLKYSPWLGIGTDASGAPGFQVVSPMTWMVGPAVCGTTCIQAAIDYSANGDTVKVRDGVFPEHVNINKSIIVTQGSSPIIDGGGSGDVVTISADNATLDGFEIRNGTNGVVLASGADNAVVKNNDIHTFTRSGLTGLGGTGADINTNTVTGPHTGSCVGGFWGIIVAGTSGSIASNTVTGIGNGSEPSGSGCQEGRGIEADGTGTLAITANDVNQYQKSGIIVRDSVNTTISGNTTTGEGNTTKIAMNGITVVSSGATSITNNQTSGHHYTGVATSTYSCGIIYLPFAAASNAIIDGNQSADDEAGICVADGTGTGVVTGVDVKNNTIESHKQRAIDVDGLVDVFVDNNTIDGQASGTTANPGTTPDDDTRYYGIFVVDSTGVISNNDITGITHGPSNGLQSGVGIRATARSGAATDVDITGNIITDVQKNAMVVTNYYGGSVNADVVGNTVTGNGPVNYIAQNGIQLSNGATGMISGNTVSDYMYTLPSWAAAGILVYSAGTTSITNNIIDDTMEGMYIDSSTVPTVSGNVITDSPDASIFVYGQTAGTYSGNWMSGGTYGLYAADSSNLLITMNNVASNGTGIIIDGASANNSVTANRVQFNVRGVDIQPFGSSPTGTLVNGNCIAGNTTAGMRVDTAVGTVNAENNWWGKVNGPNPPGMGDAIDNSTTVDAIPFLVAPVAGCPVPADGDGDGINDVNDNCPTVLNPGQENVNGEPMPLPKPVPFYDDATNPAGDNEGDACDADIDGDGLLNGAETLAGLSPFVWDTDGDRTNDGTETICGSDPLNPVSNLSGTNPDNDRLPSACEVLYGTNPSVADTDGDGVSDGVEVRYWMSNALVLNTDGDGCQDAREVASVNHDHTVNVADRAVLAAHAGALSPQYRPLDMNGDGVINVADLGFNVAMAGVCTP